MQCKQVPDYFKWIDFICKYDIHLITLPLTKMGVHYYGKNLNDSAPTEENWTRTYLEDGIVWMQVLEDMDELEKSYAKFLKNEDFFIEKK